MIRLLFHVEYRADVVDVALCDTSIGLYKRLEGYNDSPFFEVQKFRT